MADTTTQQPQAESSVSLAEHWGMFRQLDRWSIDEKPDALGSKLIHEVKTGFPVGHYRPGKAPEVVYTAGEGGGFVVDAIFARMLESDLKSVGIEPETSYIPDERAFNESVRKTRGLEVLLTYYT